MHVEAEAPAGRDRRASAPPSSGRGPGHADLAGGLKYEHDDLRDVLERASARETAARVAAGAIARQILQALGIDVVSHVTGIGDVVLPDEPPVAVRDGARRRRRHRRSTAPCPAAEAAMIAAIDRAREAGDTLGGSFEVIAQRRAGRAGVARAVGSQARWPARAGADVDSCDQGGGDRPRRRRRAPPGIARARRDRRARRCAAGRAGARPADQSRRRPRRRRDQRRGAPRIRLT